MDAKPARKMAEVHSQAHADAYLRAGWELIREVDEGDMLCDYILVWRGDEEPAKVVFPPIEPAS